MDRNQMVDVLAEKYIEAQVKLWKNPHNKVAQKLMETVEDTARENKIRGAVIMVAGEKLSEHELNPDKGN